MQNKSSLIPHLAVCITFFYNPERFVYLSTVIAGYEGIADKLDVYIITNTENTDLILECIANKDIKIEFIVPSTIGHPYLLTWVHREIFSNILVTNEVSHFLYSEDDLLFRRDNVEYWLKYRDSLQKYGLIPSFFRVEKNENDSWVSTDCVGNIFLDNIPKVGLDGGKRFLCMPNPYQGMYFLDRPLMEEFSKSVAMSPDYGIWMIREKAAQGLTFVNVPSGYSSRNLVPLDGERESIDECAWIHHLPNNYAGNPDSEFGKKMMHDGCFFSTKVNSHKTQTSSSIFSMFKGKMRSFRNICNRRKSP